VAGPALEVGVDLFEFQRPEVPCRVREEEEGLPVRGIHKVVAVCADLESVDGCGWGGAAGAIPAGPIGEEGCR